MLLIKFFKYLPPILVPILPLIFAAKNKFVREKLFQEYRQVSKAYRNIEWVFDGSWAPLDTSNGHRLPRSLNTVGYESNFGIDTLISGPAVLN